MSKYLPKGFTLIELLIVIAVLGILAVAVLAAINPIEQINRSRDTGNRSDSEQLIGAIDRFYAARGFYPWVSGASVTADSLGWTPIGTGAGWTGNGTGDALEKLSSETGELKESFIQKVTNPSYNTLYIYKSLGQSTSVYLCFKPKSQAFEEEAGDRCGTSGGGLPADVDPGGPGGVGLCTADGEWSCLP